MSDVTPGEPPQQPAVGPRTPPRPRLIVELDERIAQLEENAAEAVNSLDEDLGAMWEMMKLVVTLQGAIIEALNAMTDDPNNPASAAARARGILDDATEAAYGPAEGPEDDRVVSEPAGDQSGDS